MREAALALAETDAMLKNKREAMLAKLEGRDSLANMDYIFRESKPTD
jgi:hypothetical protein